MQSKHLRTLVECAVMLALATILAVLPVIKLPYGGSVTYASMVPIVLVSYRHGVKWGLLTGVAFSLIQMMTGFYAPPTPTFWYFTLVVLLDYVLAFGVLGLAGAAGKVIKNRTASVITGTLVVTTLRFACHLLSGIIVWGVYAEEGQTAFAYSFTYNGGYMIPEIIITTIVATLVIKIVDSIGRSKA